VAPQLSSGWQHNYSTKTRPAGHADEQSMYSLVPMVCTHHFFQTWNKLFGLSPEKSSWKMV